MADTNLQAYIEGSETISIDQKTGDDGNTVITFKTKPTGLADQLLHENSSSDDDNPMITFGTGAPNSSTKGRIYIQLP